MDKKIKFSPINTFSSQVEAEIAQSILTKHTIPVSLKIVGDEFTLLVAEKQKRKAIRTLEVMTHEFKEMLNAKQLRRLEPTDEVLTKLQRNPIYFVLDNVLDTYNIGSFFRLADAVAAEKIFICGKAETPPSSRIHKSAVGTEKWIPWEYSESAVSAVNKLKSKGVQIVALEQTKSSISYTKLKASFPIALVAGNETYGVSSEVLEQADLTVELPMFGINKSLNVWGSTAIVTYKILEKIEAI